MGKRRLNGAQFYQCDWTGLPMSAPFCYLPTWNAQNKLVKKGSYCNWESVVAHVTHMHEQGGITESLKNKINAHIAEVCGCSVEKAPHFKNLKHVGGTMDMYEFHTQSCRQSSQLEAIKLPAETGKAEQIHLEPRCNGQYDFTELQSFTYARKKTQKTQHDLCIFYSNVKKETLNTAACSIFKMQIYGDVLIVQLSREKSFLPRERFLSLSLSLYNELFTNKKRKRTIETESITVETYAQVKKQMQETLNLVEQRVSKEAVEPREMSKTTKLALPSGRRLAQGMKQSSMHAPLPPPEILLAA